MGSHTNDICDNCGEYVTNSGGWTRRKTCECGDNGKYCLHNSVIRQRLKEGNDVWTCAFCQREFEAAIGADPHTEPGACSCVCPPPHWPENECPCDCHRKRKQLQDE